jgi:hypothetical protein
VTWNDMAHMVPLKCKRARQVGSPGDQGDVQPISWASSLTEHIATFPHMALHESNHALKANCAFSETLEFRLGKPTRLHGSGSSAAPAHLSMHESSAPAMTGSNAISCPASDTSSSKWASSTSSTSASVALASHTFRAESVVQHGARQQQTTAVVQY